MASDLTIQDVRDAATRLQGRIKRTPVLTSEAIDAASGYRVYFKCENLQRAGSFKIRGALNKLLTLPEERRRRGVVAFSSGNHAQGVALAARLVGTSAVICMPIDAPQLKVDATRGYGADVVQYDRQKDDREAMARAIAADTGREVVPPYDDYAIMAGQGTAALELFEDVPDLDAVLTPVGGGGLMAGCSTVAKALRPGVTVIGVEPDTANDTYLSLQKGERVSIAPPPTVADGVRLTTPGALTFPILQHNVDELALVDDEAILAAVRRLAVDVHIVVEPTGAVPAAAVFSGRLPVTSGAKVGVVLSGGNIDPALLASVLARRS